MIASLLYLTLGILLGFTILRLTKAPLGLIEQLIWGIPIGLGLLPTWNFVLALIVRQQDLATGLAVVSAASLVIYYCNRRHNQQKIKEEWQAWWLDLWSQNNRPELIAWLFILVPWLMYTVITVPRLLFFENGNLMAGWVNIWGDWAVHLRSSTFFAAQNKISLDNPIFSGTTFHYPYISAYLSAILQRLTLPIDRSLVWPTFLLFGSLPIILTLFARRITGNRSASLIFTYIFLLAGGAGIYYLIKDLLGGHYFWAVSPYQPQTYTDMFRQPGSPNSQALWFMNFIMSELLPQRAFLAGIGTGLYVLMIVWEALKRLGASNNTDKGLKDLQPSLLLAAGLFSLMPLLHTHTFIALWLSIGCLTLLSFIRRFIGPKTTSSLPSTLVATLQHFRLFIGSFLLPSLVAGLLVLLLFVYDPSRSSSFIHSIHWWVPDQASSVNPLVYWLRNAGLLIVLATGGTLWLRHREHQIDGYGDNKYGPRYGDLWLAGFVLWLLTNGISFQPWHFDNLKILTYWYLFWSLPSAVILAQLLSYGINGIRASQTTAKIKSILVRVASIVAFLILLIGLTGAGLADTLSVTASSRTGLPLATQEGLQFAYQTRLLTKANPQALIATATNHNHPLSLVSGRRLYVGYEGWLWSYGLDWQPRYQDLQQIYQATPEGLSLLKTKRIDYLALGPEEIDQFEPNETKLHELFSDVITVGPYHLLRIEASKLP